MGSLSNAMNSEEKEFSEGCLHLKRCHQGAGEQEVLDTQRGGTWRCYPDDSEVTKSQGVVVTCKEINSNRELREIKLKFRFLPDRGRSNACYCRWDPRLAALHQSPGNSLEMQNLRSWPRPADSEYLSVVQECVLWKCPVDSYAYGEV